MSSKGKARFSTFATRSVIGGLLLAQTAGRLVAAAEPPREWIEPATGHRVIRLSREPGTASPYFHYNAYTPEGDKLVVTTSNGLAAINLNTREITALITGRVSKVIVGRDTRQAFYLAEGNRVCATSVDTAATRQITTLPSGLRIASAFGVSADEKLLAGIT